MNSFNIHLTLEYFDSNVRKASNTYLSNIKIILNYLKDQIQQKNIKIDLFERCIDILIESENSLQKFLIEKILIAVCERTSVNSSRRLIKILDSRMKSCTDKRIIIMHKMLMMKKYEIIDKSDENFKECGDIFIKYLRIKNKYQKCKQEKLMIESTEKLNAKNQNNYHENPVVLCNKYQKNHLESSCEHDNSFMPFDLNHLDLSNISSLKFIEITSLEMFKACKQTDENFVLFKHALSRYNVGEYLNAKRIFQKLLAMKLKENMLIFVLYFVSFSHLFMAEYLECNFYIDKALAASSSDYFVHVYNLFLNFKFFVERLAKIEGPTNHIFFNEYFQSKFLSNINIDRDSKIVTNLKLSRNTDLLREARTCNFIKDTVFDGFINEIIEYYNEYYFFSFYAIDEKLAYNLIYYEDKIIIKNYITNINLKTIREHFTSIMNRSKETLLRIINSRKDTEKWWTDRIKLDKELKGIVDIIDLELENQTNLAIKKAFIITDEESAFFCWESMKLFSDVSVYRIPSFEYFRCVDYKVESITVKNISYILDPENNLPNTRKQVQKLINKNKTRKISGITNKRPSIKEFNQIAISSLFLYFGHGTGEKYLPKNYAKSIKNKACFVFGCSSSRLFCRRNFRRNGIALNFLETTYNFIGCLWDVTDKDLDIFSITFLEKLFEGQHFAADIMKDSRKNMKLKYLNGAAIILWGLPVKFIY